MGRTPGGGRCGGGGSLTTPHLPAPASAAPGRRSPGLATCSTHPGAGRPRTPGRRRRALFPVPLGTPAGEPLTCEHLPAAAPSHEERREGPARPAPGSLSVAAAAASAAPAAAARLRAWGSRVPPAGTHFPASPRSREVSELLSALKEEEPWGGAFRFSLLPFYWLLDDFLQPVTDTGREGEEPGRATLLINGATPREESEASSMFEIIGQKI